MIHEFYLAEIELEGNKDFFTGIDLANLKCKVFDKIISKCLSEGYSTSIKKFKISNSEDFIAEYDEDDYQEKLDEVIHHLKEIGVEIKVTFLQMTTTLDEHKLEEVDWDFI